MQTFYKPTHSCKQVGVAPDYYRFKPLGNGRYSRETITQSNLPRQLRGRIFEEVANEHFLLACDFCLKTISKYTADITLEVARESKEHEPIAKQAGGPPQIFRIANLRRYKKKKQIAAHRQQARLNAPRPQTSSPEGPQRRKSTVTGEYSPR